MPTELSDKLRAFALEKNFAPEHYAHRLADEFAAAALGYFAEPQTVSVKQFLGAWARARRAYCELTGAPLI